MHIIPHRYRNSGKQGRICILRLVSKDVNMFIFPFPHSQAWMFKEPSLAQTPPFSLCSSNLDAQAVSVSFLLTAFRRLWKQGSPELEEILTNLVLTRPICNPTHSRVHASHNHIALPMRNPNFVFWCEFIMISQIRSHPAFSLTSIVSLKRCIIIALASQMYIVFFEEEFNAWWLSRFGQMHSLLKFS